MKTALFVPCYIDQFYPRVGIATLELLEKLGCSVEYPAAQTCCGQPLANAGFEKEALAAYRHFVRTFQDYDYIVAPSGSCTYHVRHHFDVLEQTEAVRKVRAKTLDLAEFLLDVLRVEKLEARFPKKVGLHQSCHGLRGLRLGQGSERVVPPFSKIKTLLEMVEGIVLVEVDFPDECCGFGGTFAVAEEAVSLKMGRDKIEDHRLHGADVITAGDMSCLMHLEGIARRQNDPVKCLHFAEILNCF
ncbi:MAG: (Fe-S)-binding protein [Saprospiraceae bacterium]|nr:MAG: (Fe-S)-binding protein [Saprospiraceae bacterium]